MLVLIIWHCAHLCVYTIALKTHHIEPAKPLFLFERSNSSKLNSVPQGPNLRRHADLDDIPRLQKLRVLHRISDARARPRHHNRPLLQRRALAAKRNQRRDLEAQVIDPRILPQLAVHPCLQRELAGVRDNLCADDLRPKRRVRVEALGEVPLRYCSREVGVALPLAAGDVVAGHVAADVVESVGFGDVLAVLGDDEAELAFVVGLVVLGEFGDYNGAFVVLEAGVGFDECAGVGWQCTASFLDCGGF